MACYSISKNSEVEVVNLPFPGLLRLTDRLHLLQNDLLVEVDASVKLGVVLVCIKTDADLHALIWN